MVDVGRNWLSQLCNCDNVVSSRVISRVLLTIPFAPTSSERMNTNVGNKNLLTVGRLSQQEYRKEVDNFIAQNLDRIYNYYHPHSSRCMRICDHLRVRHTNNSSECRCCLDSRRGHPISTFQYTCTATQTTGGRTYYIRVLIVANSIVHLFLVIYVS